MHSPPIGDKLGKLLRLLTSDRDGEVIAAARAIIRTLGRAGADIHALADAVEGAAVNGKTFTEQQVLESYQRGVEDDLRKAEEARFGSSDFQDTGDSMSWHEMALYCQQHIERLEKRHHDFIHDMCSKTVWREPTEKQGKYLKSLYFKIGGKP